MLVSSRNLVYIKSRLAPRVGPVVHADALACWTPKPHCCNLPHRIDHEVGCSDKIKITSGLGCTHPHGLAHDCEYIDVQFSDGLLASTIFVRIGLCLCFAIERRVRILVQNVWGCKIYKSLQGPGMPGTSIAVTRVTST